MELMKADAEPGHHPNIQEGNNMKTYPESSHEDLHFPQGTMTHIDQLRRPLAVRQPRRRRGWTRVAHSSRIESDLGEFEVYIDRTGIECIAVLVVVSVATSPGTSL